MSPRLIPAFIAALVAVVLVPVAPAAAATVHLAIVGDLSGSLTVPEAIWAGQVVGGVLGAIGERAAAAVLAGGAADPVAQPLPINVTAAAALGAAAVQAQVAATLGAVPTIVAVLAPARGAAAEGAVAACVAAGIPVVGPETTNQAHYVGATPGSNGSAVIHWRPDAVTEAVAQLKFALHGRTKSHYFLVAYTAQFAAAATAVNKTLASIAAPAPVLADVTAAYAAGGATAAAGAIVAAYSAAAVKPQGIMLLVDDPVLVATAVGLLLASGAPPTSTFFFASSFATLPLWQAPVNGVMSALPFSALFHASSIPHYADSRFVFATKFRAAAASYGGIAGAVPSLAGISGYAAARLVLAAVDRVPRSVATITGHVVLKTIYELGTIELDDWQLGAFTPDCTGFRPVGAVGCGCNSGGKVLMTTVVNGSSGFTVPFPDSQALLEVNSAETALKHDECTYRQEVLPVRVMAAFVDDLLPVATRAAQVQVMGALTSFITRRKVSDTKDRTFYAVPLAQNNITKATMLGLTARFSTFAQLLPSSIDLDAAMAKPSLPYLTLGKSQYLMDAADPPLPSFDQWNPNFIPLFPVLADFAHTAAAYAVKLGRGGSIHIVADTDALASLARRSVETHAQVPPASVAVLPETDASLVPAALAAHGSLTKGQPKAVVLVMSQNAALLGALLGAVMLGYTTTYADTVVVVCGSEYVIGDLLLNAPVPVAPNVRFVSWLPHYNIPEGSFMTEAVRQDMLRSNSLARFFPNETWYNAVRPFQAMGVEYGAFTLGADAVQGNAQDLIDHVYTRGVLAGKLTAVSPLSRAACSGWQGTAPTAGRTAPTGPVADAAAAHAGSRPAARCQCSKGLTTFYVRSLAAWRSVVETTQREPGPEFTYQLPDCGVRYTALPTEETGLRGTALLLTVAGSAVAAVAVVAATAFLLYYCCVARAGMRDNKTAPKDASQPFAIVFTDIQASTTLWAHAPHAMGPALDTHHAILRRLVSQHKGYEVKTIGDSFMVAFSDVGNAVTFALAVQDALFDHDWGTQLLDSTYQQLGFGVVPEGGEVPQASQRLPNYEDIWNGLRVRVGVHFGEGSIKFDETSKGYDYYGTVVNTAARVEGVAHGGQVLLTGDAMARLEATASKLPNSVVVDDLGPQPLRGLNEPVKLTQLLPGRFGDRKYPPLRLDVEVEVNEDEDDADEERAASGADSGTPDFEHRRPTVATLPDDSTSASGTVIDGSSPLEAVANRLARGNVNTSAHAVLFAHEVMYRALAPLPPKDQLAFAKKVAAAWRVPAEPPFGGSLRRAAKRLKPQELLMLQVSARALQAAASAGALFAPSDVDHRRSMPEATPMQGNAFTLMTSVRKDSTMLNSFAAQGSRRASNASSGAGAITASAPAPPSLPTPKHISGSVRILVPGEVGP